MNTKLAIVGMATALFVGGGLSMAVAAEPGPAETAEPPSASTTAAMTDMHPSMDTGAMEQMHAAMRDDMPADLREECDEMHAAMTAPGRGDAAGRAAPQHERHHAERPS